MLELATRPQWQTVCGGSHSYIKAFRQRFRGSLRLVSEVAKVRRSEQGVSVVTKGGELEAFDKVILATHADEALSLLEDPSEHELQALGSWRYSRNRTVLHTDASVLGPKKRLWAAWNYRRRLSSTADSPVAITYYMNKLQNLETSTDYFVTLNAEGDIKPESILYETVYTHPIYTPQSPVSQRAIRALNGTRHTYFCGAYMRYGFHEDAVQSALDVTRAFGLEL
jgi:predicted NAD/FAD-binding protein